MLSNSGFDNSLSLDSPNKTYDKCVVVLSDGAVLQQQDLVEKTLRYKKAATNFVAGPSCRTLYQIKRSTTSACYVYARTTNVRVEFPSWNADEDKSKFGQENYSPRASRPESTRSLGSGCAVGTTYQRGNSPTLPFSSNWKTLKTD